MALNNLQGVYMSLNKKNNAKRNNNQNKTKKQNQKTNRKSIFGFHRWDIVQLMQSIFKIIISLKPFSVRKHVRVLRLITIFFLIIIPHILLILSNPTDWITFFFPVCTEELLISRGHGRTIEALWEKDNDSNGSIRYSYKIINPQMKTGRLS